MTPSETLGDSDTVNLRSCTGRWIAAHADFWGEEKADELAKLGTTNNSLLKCPTYSTVLNYNRRKVYEKASKLNLKDWIDYPITH